jgi:excisionase family DNA binding protein
MENPFELLFNKLTVIENALNELVTDKNDTRKQTESDSEFLNITQASEYLFIAIQTIYGLTASRKIPHYKTGKRLYFKRQELDDYILENRIATLEEIENKATEWLARKHPSKKKQKNILCSNMGFNTEEIFMISANGATIRKCLPYVYPRQEKTL